MDDAIATPGQPTFSGPWWKREWDILGERADKEGAVWGRRFATLDAVSRGVTRPIGRGTEKYLQKHDVDGNPMVTDQFHMMPTTVGVPIGVTDTWKPTTYDDAVNTNSAMAEIGLSAIPFEKVPAALGGLQKLVALSRAEKAVQAGKAVKAAKPAMQIKPTAGWSRDAWRQRRAERELSRYITKDGLTKRNVRKAKPGDTIHDVISRRSKSGSYTRSLLAGWAAKNKPARNIIDAFSESLERVPKGAALKGLGRKRKNAAALTEEIGKMEMFQRRAGLGDDAGKGFDTAKDIALLGTRDTGAWLDLVGKGIRKLRGNEPLTPDEAEILVRLALDPKALARIQPVIKKSLGMPIAAGTLRSLLLAHGLSEAGGE